MPHANRLLFSAIMAAALTVVASPAALAQPPKDVVVVNTPAQPVPVAVQSMPTVQPFQVFLADFMADGEFNMGDDLAVTVPAGKRLVIETISVIVSTADGQNVRMRLDATGSGGAAAHHLTVSKESWGSAIDHKGIQSLHVYADAGETVHIRVARDQGLGIGNVNASISGYLVNVP